MRRRREWLLPAAAVLALAAVGVLVLVLLTTAVENGRQALEESVLAEVQANARSQDAGVAAQLATFTSLLGDLTEGFEFKFTVGSASDLEGLGDLIRLLERSSDFRTGFYLTDASGVATRGSRVRGGPHGQAWCGHGSSAPPAAQVAG